MINVGLVYCQRCEAHGPAHRVVSDVTRRVERFLLGPSHVARNRLVQGDAAGERPLSAVGGSGSASASPSAGAPLPARAAAAMSCDSAASSRVRHSLVDDVARPGEAEADGA